MKPGRGRAKWEGIMVYVRRRVMDDFKVFQEKTLAVVYPLAYISCLNKCEHRFLKWILYTTHRHVPFLDVVEGINSNIKLPHQAEDFNPKQ